MKWLVYFSVIASALALMISAGLFYANSNQDVYTIKSYKYFADDEVEVLVTLKTGHVEKYICAFPPNTDYEHMNKVKIGNIKAQYLLGGALYYCNAIK